MQILELINSVGGLGQVILGSFIALGMVVAFFVFAKTFVRICGPNEALILSGFLASSELDGKKVGFKPVIGGRCFSIPGLTQVDRLPLTLMEVPIAVRNAYSKGGIAMNVEAIANVKVSSDLSLIRNAIERFLDRDVAEVQRVAKETLEGHLRGVVALLTPEQVNEDRLTFAEELARESELDLAKLGLHLDTLKILHVSDEIGYLDATGRKAIAAVIREAEIAESDAHRDAEQSEAQNKGRAEVTRANVETEVLKLRNEFRRVQADLESKVRSEEERTTAAAKEARAVAEQKLQTVRASLETIRLRADKVLPAEAQKRAQEFRAKGEAAAIRERGAALSEVLETMQKAWTDAGDSATQIAVITDLERLVKLAGDAVRKVEVEQVRVIDSGDGSALPNFVSAYPKLLGSMFEALAVTTGIDVPAAVRGQKDGK